MIVAVIPARGGSQRIPRKNIKNFAGKPMIAWSILAAKRAAIFDRIVVSTDSPEIIEVAQEWGAEAPFLRPSSLADGHTPTAPVLSHALRALSTDAPTYACCLYPTAPFVSADALRQGLELLRTTDAPGALSVTTFDFPILRALRRLEDGSVAFNWPEHELTRSQDLPEFYHDAGQFYWVRVEAFLSSERLIMPGMLPLVLPRKRVQDLDTPEDWENAELMAQVLLRNGEMQ